MRIRETGRFKPFRPRRLFQVAARLFTLSGPTEDSVDLYQDERGTQLGPPFVVPPSSILSAFLPSFLLQPPSVAPLVVPFFTAGVTCFRGTRYRLFLLSDEVVCQPVVAQRRRRVAVGFPLPSLISLPSARRDTYRDNIGNVYWTRVRSSPLATPIGRRLGISIRPRCERVSFAPCSRDDPTTNIDMWSYSLPKRRRVDREAR